MMGWRRDGPLAVCVCHLALLSHSLICAGFRQDHETAAGDFAPPLPSLIQTAKSPTNVTSPQDVKSPTDVNKGPKHVEKHKHKHDKMPWPVRKGLYCQGGQREECAGIKPSYFHVHIPKAAGYSVIADSIKLLTHDASIYSKELCVGDVEHWKTHYNGRMITFVRSPLEHVYSQYTMCKFECGRWCGHGRDMHRKDYDTVTTWLRHFTQNIETGGIVKPQDGLGCYNPLDMQTRYLSCNYSRQLGPSAKHSPHDIHLDDPEALVKAIANLDKFFVIGMVEHYRESMCLFADKVNGVLPLWCNCANSAAVEAFKPLNVTHHVPAHSISDLSDEDKRMIGMLTKHDVVLYETVKARFLTEVQGVEKKHGMKVFCDDGGQ